MRTHPTAIAALSLVALTLSAPRVGAAQADEIQVYDGGVAPPGVFNLTLHNNFTPNGLRTPAFAGGIRPDKALNGVPEWAYGVTDWFEAGFYLPLYSIGNRAGHTAALLNGFKLRLLFAAPRAAERTFFYGVNFEFSYNARHWDPTRFTSEIRPIIGWHLRPLHVIVNPIFDTAYDGLENLDFAPATRVACDVGAAWQLALEEYDDFGPVHQFYSGGQQGHQLYGVIDHSSKALDVEAGVGFGLTGASDKITLKLILARDLN